MKLKAGVALSVFSMGTIFLVSCGNNEQPLSQLPTRSRTQTQMMNGNFDFGCGFADGSGHQTQKQNQKIPYQQQQQSCEKPEQQQIQYKESNKFTDLDVNLDCEGKQVSVRNKGKDLQQEHFAIQRDGSVQGQMKFQEQMQSDGKGNQECWVEYQVVFNGKASCPKEEQQQKKLSLNTQVKVVSTTPEHVKVTPPDDVHSPSSTPSTVSSHSPAASPEWTPSPSPSPSVSPWPSVRPTPSVTVIPVTVCQVVDTCPVSADSDFSCN